MQVAKFLEDKFPELKGKIVGGLYPAPPAAEFASNVLSILQLIGIAWMVVGGDKLLRMIGFKGPLPGFYWTVQDNAVPLMIGLFLLAPQIVSSLSNKGAFEIYLGDTEIYSKMANGKMPSAEELVEPLVALGLQSTGN